MENLAHTLLGATLYRAGLGKNTAWALPTLMVAANFPDIDNFVGRGDNYFDYHRGITHSLVGIAFLSAALAGAVWVIGRFRRRGAANEQKFLPLWLISAAGMLTHPFLDFLGDYGLRPFLPFSSDWYYGDMISIVDPWLWLIFGCALFLTTLSKFGKIAWILTAAVLDALILVSAGPAFALEWIVVAAIVLWAGNVLRNHGRQPAHAALVLFLVYLGAAEAGHLWIREMASSSGPALVSAPIEKISVLPGRPGTVVRWTVVMESSEEYFVADVGLQNWASHPPGFETYGKNLDNPYYLRALNQNRMAVLARFARFPSVQVECSNDSCTVFLRDVRYARRGTSGWGVASATIPIGRQPAGSAR